MASPLPTILDLLEERSRTSSALINFLDDQGNVTSSISFPELFDTARNIANALLSSGIKGGGEDIVITNFGNQRDHVLLFWGCCFAGIPICPTAPLHPDESRRLLFFEHLQQLFHGPTFISDATTVGLVKDLIPILKTTPIEEIHRIASDRDVAIDVSKIYPDRVASPDQTVALMLTSGSTGNSKGVVLPHSLLMSSINGKALKHGTTHDDVFLSWINFDHVANVTESHLLAILHGATQYLVSASAVVSKPRNLLDWISKHHGTHTFCPNFLLAQICRDTSLVSSVGSEDSPDLSSLRFVITGGEMNPVTTAVEFSDLIERFGAPRSTLRIAFGMTETGAGNIYNNGPILRTVDGYNGRIYLPVGTPCEGSVARIVDPSTSLPCPPNVPGLLQLSGPTIFKKYYANERANRESFPDIGWFTTGDFAFFDESGNIHMRGRDKQDININGVKQLSADVELYLEDSNISGLKPSFVFVSAIRLDGADTETYAVFYQHANVDMNNISKDGLSDQEVADILTTNRRIQTQCHIFSSHAAHIVLPLPSENFVKSALGKVSRPQLAAAYMKGKYAHIEKYLVDAAAALKEKKTRLNEHSPRSTMDEVLCQWVAEAFDVDNATLDISQNLLDLGASSMHLIRFQQFIKNRFGIKDLPTIEMLKRPVISELSAWVQQLVDGTQDDASPKIYNPLVCLSPHGTKPPLYLVHPGVGEVLVFINLSRLLDDDRPVYALRARGFEAGETPPETMQEMVDIYAAAIQKNNPTGPYFLAGYSFGGAIAFEIGKSLEKDGLKVAWLGILNLPPFIQFRVKELVWVETLLNLTMFLDLIRTDEFDSFKDRLIAANPGGDSDSEPKNAQQMIEWTLANSKPGRLAELNMPVDYFHRWVNVAYQVSLTGRTYLPTDAVYGALTSVFCAIPLPSMGTKEEYKRDRLSRWMNYSGKHFELIDVDGEHYTMLSEQHIESFSQKMRGAIHRAEEFLVQRAK